MYETSVICFSFLKEIKGCTLTYNLQPLMTAGNILKNTIAERNNKLFSSQVVPLMHMRRIRI